MSNVEFLAAKLMPFKRLARRAHGVYRRRRLADSRFKCMQAALNDDKVVAQQHHRS
jgi:hypothetical protein